MRNVSPFFYKYSGAIKDLIQHMEGPISKETASMIANAIRGARKEARGGNTRKAVEIFENTPKSKFDKNYALHLLGVQPRGYPTAARMEVPAWGMEHTVGLGSKYNEGVEELINTVDDYSKAKGKDLKLRRRVLGLALGGGGIGAGLLGYHAAKTKEAPSSPADKVLEDMVTEKVASFLNHFGGGVPVVASSDSKLALTLGLPYGVGVDYITNPEESVSPMIGIGLLGPHVGASFMGKNRVTSGEKTASIAERLNELNKKLKLNVWDDVAIRLSDDYRRDSGKDKKEQKVKKA